ncbi:372c09f7-8cc6-4116-82b0-b4f06d07e679 [Thermothielavioides terrestris]|uniref:372c09f7-8cc6-4116-82b0-b4f06d07e679 n=1 Tax=Thermothielavioides terrestris TaxID=2587410 RepID=A0A3S4C289_9PEZI|nr:372c09f7-8cc6-4116-82b0-b4f06d07e679 [Thermothielavioides terrestris]
MANRTIYTRCFSARSPRQLVSGKGAGGRPLDYKELLYEFQNHVNKQRDTPTALVSVSNRIVDTVQRALKKHEEEDESPADIWIVFIQVPAGGGSAPARFHAARHLAEQIGHRNPALFHHETVFEWAIPEHYEVHRVSLQTLLSRGLDRELGTQASFPTTRELRCSLAAGFERRDPWELGLDLGFFAKCFGARAPLKWIAIRLYWDCVAARFDEHTLTFDLEYAHGLRETVDATFFRAVDDGLDTAVFDWWLTDSEFLDDYEEFKSWQTHMLEGDTVSQRDIEAVEQEAVRIGL